MPKPETLAWPIVRQGSPPSFEEVDTVLRRIITGLLASTNEPIGILLSGGVDSSLLTLYVKELQQVQYFTIGKTLSHPDVGAAWRLAREWSLKPYVAVQPSDPEMISEAEAEVAKRPAHFRGDAGVLMACRLAAENGVKVLLATDGIDETMGGYWWHANTSDLYATQLRAFQDFWERLWDEHLVSLEASAAACGMRVLYPYLDPELVRRLTAIPLVERVPAGKPKDWWKRFAGWRGVPAWVIQRPKVGFVDALRAEW